MSLCRKVQELIPLYILKDCDNDEASRVREHLQECNVCREYFQYVTQLYQSFKTTEEVNIPEIGPEIVYNVNMRIDRFRKKRRIIIAAIIPSFALERTQEVAYYLNQLLMENRIPEIPIYVDSPLAVNITDVFLRHPECFDKEMLEAFREGDDPLGAKRINYITDVNDSKGLNEIHEPMVIISASGMCEAGRILHHLRNNIENPKNTVLVVGYMAKNTLGRKLVERKEKVKIFGLEHPLRAEVVVINAFSAHADRNDLLNYALKFKDKVKNIFIVHGDEDQSEALLELLKENGLPAYLPVPHEEVEIS